MTRSRLVRDFIHAEWMPLLGITVFFIMALSLIAPAFLTEYNLFVMLRILSAALWFLYRRQQKGYLYSDSLSDFGPSRLSPSPNEGKQSLDLTGRYFIK